jgi:hypothetical protein
MQTGYAIIVAGFFVGAAIMFAGADIAHAINLNNAGGSAGGGLLFVVFGGLGLLMYLNAMTAKTKEQQSPPVGEP